MAAIDGPAGPSMATKSAMDGPAGPAVAGDHLRRDSTLALQEYWVESISRVANFKSAIVNQDLYTCNFFQPHLAT